MTKYQKHKKPKKVNDYNKSKRRNIYERDNYSCRICGEQAHSVHHIMFRSHCGNNSDMNLIALCTKCHQKVHNDEKKWRPKLLILQKQHYPTITISMLKKK